MDNTQLYVHLTHMKDDVEKWLFSNKLKLNQGKTEYIIFGSKMQRENSTNLSQLIFLVISCLLMRQSGTLAGGLTEIFLSPAMFRTSVSLVLLKSQIMSYDCKCFVGRLSHCDSLFRNLSALHLRKLQCVQNCLVRIVTNTHKYSHITPVTKSLH